MRATMRRPHGVMIVTGPDGTREYDTITCVHCQRIVVPAREEHGFCRLCMDHICAPCVGQPCVPFMKALDAYERKLAFRSVLEGR